MIYGSGRVSYHEYQFSYEGFWDPDKKILQLDVPVINICAGAYAPEEVARNIHAELERSRDASQQFQYLHSLLPYVQTGHRRISGTCQPITIKSKTAAEIADAIVEWITDRQLEIITIEALREAEEYIALHNGIAEYQYIWGPITPTGAPPGSMAPPPGDKALAVYTKRDSIVVKTGTCRQRISAIRYIID